MAEMLVIKSPLKAWPGEMKLPQPDDFNGVQWQVWKESFNNPKRKSYSLTHLYCYSGLELIQAAGEWNFEIPLSEILAWEYKPDDERIKFVAWLGRSINNYWDSIVDPKE